MMKDPDQYKSASVQELMHRSWQIGVKLWPCDMTMDMMGPANEDLLDGMEKPAGASSAISLMKQASISLFRRSCRPGPASRWSSSPPTAFPVRTYRPGRTTWVMSSEGTSRRTEIPTSSPRNPDP